MRGVTSQELQQLLIDADHALGHDAACSRGIGEEYRCRCGYDALHARLRAAIATDGDAGSAIPRGGELTPGERAHLREGAMLLRDYGPDTETARTFRDVLRLLDERDALQAVADLRESERDAFRNDAMRERRINSDAWWTLLGEDRGGHTSEGAHASDAVVTLAAARMTDRERLREVCEAQRGVAQQNAALHSEIARLSALIGCFEAAGNRGGQPCAKCGGAGAEQTPGGWWLCMRCRWPR